MVQEALVQPLDPEGLDDDFLVDDPDNVDSYMAKELTSLSTLDRERIYHDIHGISGEFVETKDSLQESLQQLEKELAASSLDKRAYELALKQNPKFVQNDEFRRRFLRAERFDAKAAAKRYLLHFNLKYDFFGEKLLTKHITQEDLDPADVDLLYNCVAYRMPIQDPAGRPVLFYTAPPATDTSVRAFVRRMFYATMVTSEDELTQRKGCVIVSYLVGLHFHFEGFLKRREISRWNATVFCSVPLRVEALHLCIDSFYWRPFLAIFKLTVSMSTRLRCREHYGDQNSVLFSLQTHGIAMDCVEAAVTSTESNANVWKKRRELEHIWASTKKERVDGTVIAVPRRSDVLLGRGKTVYNHVGNLRLRNFVEQFSKQYEDASVDEKTMLADVIILHIKKDSGRFLRDDGYGWVEVPNEVARKKVAHAFRTLRAQSRGGAVQQPRTDKKRGRNG